MMGEFYVTYLTISDVSFSGFCPRFSLHLAELCRKHLHCQVWNLISKIRWGSKRFEVWSSKVQKVQSLGDDSRPSSSPTFPLGEFICIRYYIVHNWCWRTDRHRMDSWLQLGLSLGLRDLNFPLLQYRRGIDAKPTWQKSLPHFVKNETESNQKKNSILIIR